MVQFGMVQPGAGQVASRLRGSSLQGRYSPARTRASRCLAEHHASLSAIVERDLDRAEAPLRQHIARSVERLAAAPVPG